MITALEAQDITSKVDRVELEYEAISARIKVKATEGLMTYKHEYYSYHTDIEIKTIAERFIKAEFVVKLIENKTYEFSWKPIHSSIEQTNSNVQVNTQAVLPVNYVQITRDIPYTDNIGVGITI